MKKRFFCIIAALAIFMAALPEVTFAKSVSASIPVLEDAFTQESAPDDAVGGMNAITITTSSTGGSKPAAATRDVYLKFDVRPYELSKLTSAKIRLHITSVANKADRDLSVYAVEPIWSESEITWNNAPSEGEKIAAYRQVYDSKNNKNIWINIDVTNYVKAHFDEGVLSFKITSDTGATKMDSKETPNPPTLEISFDTQNETGTVVVKCQNEQGEDIAKAIELKNISVGEFQYKSDVREYLSRHGIEYKYNEEASVRNVTVSAGKVSEIILRYDDPIKVPSGVFKKAIQVSEDTFAKQNEATKIFNTEDPENLQVTMNMGAAGAAARRDGFVKFDLSDIPYTFITSAYLTGYVTSATNDGTRVIGIYETESDNWSEKTLNWNNAPASRGEAIATIALDTNTTGKWLTADITEYARSAKSFSFRMISDTGATAFATKDGDSFNAMTLVIRYTTDENYTLAPVTVRIVDTEGKEIAQSFVMEDCLVGDYYYTKEPDRIINNENGVFIFERALSKLHITVSETGENVIELVYKREGENMGISTLSELGGWSTGADPRAVKDGDMTYVSYIDNLGNIKATQYDNINNTYKQVFVKTGFLAEDHANPSILVLQDHRVMIIYAAHGEEECFYYRISTEPGDISSFGEEKCVSTKGFGTVSYPAPFYMENAPESFFLLWRGGAQPTIARFSLPDDEDEIRFEAYPKVFIKSDKTPFAKYTSDGKSKIYTAFTYANPDSSIPNTLYSAYIDISDMCMYDAEGTLLVDLTAAPYEVKNDESGIATVDRTEERRNSVWDIALDKDGNPVIAYVSISRDSTEHLYYRAKWSGETWQKTFIANGGKWFHDNTKGAEKAYSGGLALDHANPDIVFAALPQEGIYGTYYEIYKYVIGEDAVTRKAVTENSSENNFRPCVVLNAKEDDAVYLVWLSGEYYYWSNKKDFLPSNGNVKYGFTNKVMTASRLTGYDPTSDFESIDLGDTACVVSDLAFRKTTVNGLPVTWRSSDTDVIKDDGALIRPEEVREVTVTATVRFSNQTFEKEYKITVYPRKSIQENLVLKYDFDEGDIYEENGLCMIKDKSQNGNDARMFGTVGKISGGVLDLTQNKRDAANGNRPNSANSYLLAPDYLLSSLRSYTFTGRVKLSDTSFDYRLYDFGSGGTNSVFGRLSKSFQAGIKINDGTTQYVSCDKALLPNVWYDVAYTYDAATRVTKVYLDGSLVASGKTIETEAMELLGENRRNYIGRSQWWDTYYDYTARENPDFNGYLDSFALYDAALSEDEIARMVGGGSFVEILETDGGSVTARVTNETLERCDYTLFVSVSDEGSFDVKSTEISLDPAEDKTAVIAFGGTLANKEIKAFIWNRKTLLPLGPSAKR